MEISNPLSSSIKDLYTPIKKIGKWTILVQNSNNSSICVCDGMYTDWPIVYHYDFTVAYDHPERIPEGVKKWIRTVYANRVKESIENNK